MAVGSGARPFGPHARGATEVIHGHLINTGASGHLTRRPGIVPASARPNHPPCHLWWRARVANSEQMRRAVVVPLAQGRFQVTRL